MTSEAHISHTTTTGWATERRLEIPVADRLVPAVVWTPPAGDAPPPLVLVGHGGGGHKRAPQVIDMAEGLAREHGIATLAIDGPANGDRPDNTEAARLLRDRDRVAYRRAYYESRYRHMVEDWRGALDAVRRLPDVGAGPVGYWGLSMGTRFGLPLVVAEPRIDAAVLGLFGLKAGTPGNRPVYDAAPRLSCPTLFLMQLDDEEVGRRPYLDLFDALGTRDKRIHANPGRHARVPEDERRASRRFLAERLTRATPR